MSRILFPLRTSVELFGDRETPEVVARVKNAAVLYDEVIVEDGLYTADISTEGNNSWWLPWETVTPDHLAGARKPAEPGAPVALGFQAQPGPGEPGTGPVHWISQGNLLIRFGAEFRTGILDELSDIDPPWLQVIATGGQEVPVGAPPPVREAIKALNWQDFRDRDLMPDRSSFERSWIYKAFNHDAVVAGDLDAAFNVTPLFAPMLERHGLAVDRRGEQALSVLVPDAGRLDWEAICEFREHPGCEDARGKLREFEQRAQEQEPEDAEAFLRGVSQQISQELLAAVNDLKPKWTEDSAKEAAKLGIGFIPIVGQYIAGAASAAEIIHEGTQFRKSWVAALLKLQQASRS